MIPAHIQHEYEALSNAQKAKFSELIMWANASGLPGVALPMNTYESILEMVKRMGATPDTPAEPDRMVNHDWNIFPKQR